VSYEPVPIAIPRSNRKGTNLIDDGGGLPDQPLAHPVQRLQVELIRRLGGDEFHRRPLHCLGNRFRAER